MLSYISHKFSHAPPREAREPRAALFLNRFTRTLPIMYATDGLADLLGITAAELNGKSFYFCIQENCLRDAVKCLESAKANDSIAYVRFWYRDPRQDDDHERDEPMVDGVSSGDDDDGGVHLSDRMDEDTDEMAVTTGSSGSQSGSSKGWAAPGTHGHPVDGPGERLTPSSTSMDLNSRTSSGNSTDFDGNAADAVFDQPNRSASSASSFSNSANGENGIGSWRARGPASPVELEAVISCTSDGLVVVLRQARPAIPRVSTTAAAPVPQRYHNGLFASPWAAEPILPYASNHPHNEAPNPFPLDTAPARPVNATVGVPPHNYGPQSGDFMDAIREVAVFAWALTGINGSMAAYSRGKPAGESQPPSLPIWDPKSQPGMDHDRYNHSVQHYSKGERSRSFDSRFGTGDPEPPADASWLRRTPQRQVWAGLLPRNQDAYGNGDLDQARSDGMPSPQNGYSNAPNGYV